MAFEVSVPAAEEDAATVLLWELGTTGIEVKPEGEERTTLLAYFPDVSDLAAAVTQALSVIDGARVRPVEVEDVDWVKRYRDSFVALRVGGFAIVPAWEVPPHPDAHVLTVDPGPAFGTGTHETTRLCLLALDRRLSTGPPPRRTLDLGTGSGILAVAALRLGLPFVVGLDPDPDAMASARAHAALNGVTLHLVRGDGGRPLCAGAFDLVLANLTAGLLAERQDEIGRLLAPRATLVLSGLLTVEAPAFRDHYAPLGRVEVFTEGEWAALVLECP